VPAYFNIFLDTTAPAGITLDIGTGTVTSQDRTAAIGTSDGDTTGYQMKLWGDVDLAYDANVQDTEVASAWVAYSVTKAIRLSAGDGAKTVNLRVRDDVGNESAPASDSVTLSTAIPSINITVGPDRTRISKIAGFRTVSFTFSTDRAISAYKVKVVPADSSLDTAGTQLGTTNGSTNVSGGAVAAAGTVNVQIDGRDLEAASVGDGSKVIKVFGQDDANGQWSA
jgi:hypothetical protein